MKHCLAEIFTAITFLLGGFVGLIHAAGYSNVRIAAEPDRPVLHGDVEEKDGQKRLVMTATDEPQQPSAALGERLYTNPVYRWSLSYPSGWTLENGDLSFVRITSSANNALCGVHSGAVPFKTVEEFADTALASAQRYFRDRGHLFVIFARRQLSLPNDIIGIDVLTGIGAGGKSRRLYVLVEPRGFAIDCETYVKDWDRLEPFYDRIVRSFTVGK